MSKNYKTADCTHNGATRVFKVSKTCAIWAGAKDELLDRPGWALVISAVGFTEFTNNPLAASPGARELLPSALFEWSAPACVGITWPDRGAPPLGADWWAALAKALPGVKGNIGLCCMGGHGRTGVMLAILAALLGKVPKSDCPVAWVRERYCKSAVESDAQLDYVERITGRKVFTEPSDAPFPMATGPGPGPNVRAAGAAADANPTELATGPGSGDGVVRGDNPWDEEMLDAWFKADGDWITTIDAHGKTEFVVPVWDKGGNHVGWRTATAMELRE